MKPFSPRLLLAGSFLIAFSDSLLVICLFIFSISLCFSLGRLYFSKNLSVSPGYPFYWHIVAFSRSSLLWCFLYLYFLLPFLMLFQSCLFSLMSLAKDLSNLFYLFKEPAFSFLDVCYCLFISISFFFFFCSDLYDFFLSTNFLLLLWLFFSP